MMSNNKRAWSDAPGHVVMRVQDVEIGLDVSLAAWYMRDLVDAVNAANGDNCIHLISDKWPQEEKPSKWRAFWEGFSGMWLIKCISFDVCYFSFMTILAFFMSYAENYAGAITVILSMMSYFVFMINFNMEKKQ
jgi:hypothetical protein